MRDFRHIFFLWIIIPLFLFGCTTTARVETPTDAAALALISIDNVAQQVSEELRRGTITVEDAREAHEKLSEALGWVSLAKAAIARGEPGEATEYLELVTIVLDGIEDRLRRNE